MLMAMATCVQPGPHAQKNLKRYGIISIRCIKRRGLRIHGYIRAHAQLPRMVLDEVAHPAKSVGPDPRPDAR